MAVLVFDGTTWVGPVKARIGDVAGLRAALDAPPAHMRADATGTSLGFASSAAGNSSTALGINVSAAGDSSTALGRQSSAAGDSSTALGGWASSAGNSSTALGITASAAGDSSTALGGWASSAGNSSTALGRTASAAGDSSTALGRQSSAAGNSSTALGCNATVGATHNHSTAIGADPYATVATTRARQIMLGAPGTEVNIPGTLVLRSPDGSEWNITVDDTGALTTAKR